MRQGQALPKGGRGRVQGGSERVRASVYRLAAVQWCWYRQWLALPKFEVGDEGRRGGKGEEAEEGMGAQQTCRPDGFERKDVCRVRGGRLLFELGTGSAVRRAGDSAACGRRVRLQRRVQPTTAPPSHPWHRQCWGTLMPPPLQVGLSLHDPTAARIAVGDHWGCGMGLCELCQAGPASTLPFFFPPVFFPSRVALLWR